MNYPDNLKIGDTIGICAPSCGIVKPEKILKLELAKKQLIELGYNVIETESVRTELRGRSATAKKRAEEFMELYKNPNVKLIIFATGGDFLCEMLEYIDLKELEQLKPKWIQGYSDITGLSFIFNTILDIPTMYSQSIKDYAMRPLFRSLKDTLKLKNYSPKISSTTSPFFKTKTSLTPFFSKYKITSSVITSPYVKTNTPGIS